MLFCFYAGRIVVLHAFMKTTRATPVRELKLTKSRFALLKRRMTLMTKNKHLGPSLDDVLDGEGIRKEVDALAQKKLIALQLRDAMTELAISEVVMARRMRTSRTSVRKLLDPDSDSATLITLAKAAHAVGRTLHVSLERTKVVAAPKSRAAENRTRYGKMAKV